MGTSSYSVNDWNNYVRSTRLDTAVSAQQIYRSSYALPEFNTTGKKSPTSVGGAMNCPIVFREYDII